MQRRPSPVVAFSLLALAVTGLLGLSLASGSVPLRAVEVFEALGPGSPSLARDVVLELRLPRALAAFAVGGLLALAGALLQVLLRNPLADPYVLGVSGGASVAALAAIMLGLPAVGVDGFAALGALAACLLVFALAQGPGGWTPTRLLLTGIVVAAGAGSIVSLLLALGDETRLRGMVFWLLGDLSGTQRWPWLLALLAAATGAGIVLGRHLNVLARGVAQAATVVRRQFGADGVRCQRRRQHRLRRAGHAPPCAPRARQRQPRGAAGGGAAWRRAADGRGPRGARADRPAPAAGRGAHGAGRRAALPAAHGAPAGVTGRSGGNVTTWSVASRTPIHSPMRWSWWLGTSDSTRRPLGSSSV